MNYEIAATVRWCECHGFPWKLANEHVVLWQTNAATGEYDCLTKTTRWHDAEYFCIARG